MPAPRLLQHPFFAELPPMAVLPVAAVAEERHYLPGQVILAEGSPSDGVYFLDKGTVQLIVHNELGGTEVAAAYPGDCFGELGVIDGEPRSADAVASTLAVTFWVPGAAFHKLVEESPRACLQLLRILASRLRRTTQSFVELVNQPLA